MNERWASSVSRLSQITTMSSLHRPGRSAVVYRHGPSTDRNIQVGFGKSESYAGIRGGEKTQYVKVGSKQYPLKLILFPILGFLYQSIYEIA